MGERRAYFATIYIFCEKFLLKNTTRREISGRSQFIILLLKIRAESQD